MSKESEVNRRDFLKTGAGLAALGGITFITHPERVFGANDRVRVAVCGVRGRGWDHVKELAKIPQAEIAAFCDVDENVLAQRLKDNNPNLIVAQFWHIPWPTPLAFQTFPWKEELLEGPDLRRRAEAPRR